MFDTIFKIKIAFLWRMQYFRIEAFSLLLTIYMIIRLYRKPKLVSFNHEGHEAPEEGMSIYSACLCDLRDLRGEITIGRKRLELSR